jgi:hypothetical protein
MRTVKETEIVEKALDHYIELQVLKRKIEQVSTDSIVLTDMFVAGVNVDDVRYDIRKAQINDLIISIYYACMLPSHSTESNLSNRRMILKDLASKRYLILSKNIIVHHQNRSFKYLKNIPQEDITSMVDNFDGYPEKLYSDYRIFITECDKILNEKITI